ATQAEIMRDNNHLVECSIQFATRNQPWSRDMYIAPTSHERLHQRSAKDQKRIGETGYQQKLHSNASRSSWRGRASRGAACASSAISTGGVLRGLSDSSEYGAYSGTRACSATLIARESACSHARNSAAI